MTLLKFEYFTDILEFQAGSEYPTVQPYEMLQVVDRTSGGKLQVEDLGITIKTITLNFNLMKKVDYDALVNWFLNIANGAANEFQLTDEYGEVFQVRFQESTFGFSEVFLNTFSGTLTMEVTG